MTHARATNACVHGTRSRVVVAARGGSGSEGDDAMGTGKEVGSEAFEESE